jgi:hypothetical protein
VALPPRSRRTVNAEDVGGLAAAEFSTVIESDLPVVADRTMRWDATGYGSHAETSIASPALLWYLAEGATHSGFDLFYLVQNASSSDASIEITYLRSAPLAPVVRPYVIPANARHTIWVDTEGPALANHNLSAVIRSTNNVPISVERAMYLNVPGQTFGAGHDSAGITEPKTSWFLAEGATGEYFDLFILVANPSGTDAAIQARFLLEDGTVITKQYTAAANSRLNIFVDDEDPRLANAAVSTTITSTNGVPVIVERAMWWPGPTPSTWSEAHNSAGATATGTMWAMAEGEVGGAFQTETYILLANTSPAAAPVRVTLLFEDGTAPVSKTFSVNPNARFNVNAAAEFPAAAGRRFGAIVESLGAVPAQIVVERAMYSNSLGVIWAAGTNALATRIQ